MTLVSFFEKAFSVFFRLPELWLETWWRLLRHPLKAPLLLAFSTRRSFDLALPSSIFFLINIIVIYFLSSGLQEHANLDLQKFSRLEDYSSISILICSIFVTSVSTFTFTLIARGLGVRPTLAKLLSAALVYYLSVQLVILTAMAFILYYVGATNSVPAFLVLGVWWTPLLIWIFGALALIRASPRDKLSGWRKFLLTGALTGGFTVLTVGLGLISFLIGDYLRAYPLKTIDIVDGNCKIDKSGLSIEVIVYNSYTTMYKITGISITVGTYLSMMYSNDNSSEDGGGSHRYIINHLSYLKPSDTETIRGTVPIDKFLDEAISSHELLRCRYEVNFSVPSSDFKEDWLPGG